MKHPIEIIEELKSTPGMNDKRSILRREKDNDLFKLVLTYALDPRITFGIKRLPKYSFVEDRYPLEKAIRMLDNLHTREYTGNAATIFVKSILEHVTPENAKIIEFIIAKDFKAGFGVSLINKEMAPFQIYEVPYMGAISFNEKKVRAIFEGSKSAYSEIKMDGRYLNVIADIDGEVILESRGGKPNPLWGALEKEAAAFSEAAGAKVVLNGELMFAGEKNRYLANGIIASYVSIAQKIYDGKNVAKEAEKFEKEYGLTLEEARDRITLVVWDFLWWNEFLEKKSTRTRKERLKELEELVKKSGSFQLIEYKAVNSYAEAMEHFHEALKRGEEGTILKAEDGLWEDKKPNYQIKMKLEINLDLRITGYNWGTPGTKYEQYITSLNVESEDGLLKTSPGGIREADMKYITEHQEELLGKLVEIKCSGLSQNSDGEWACLHPAFLGIRDDKEHGDTLESAIAVENMAKGLK